MVKRKNPMQAGTYTARLRKMLDQNIGKHSVVAREAGVAQATVSRIHNGTCSPKLETVEKLLAWFKENKKGAKRSPRRKPAKACEGAGHSAKELSPACTCGAAVQESEPATPSATV
jgi:transcriptional regulator with XRE-family HTH domain